MLTSNGTEIKAFIMHARFRDQQLCMMKMAQLDLLNFLCFSKFKNLWLENFQSDPGEKAKLFISGVSELVRLLSFSV